MSAEENLRRVNDIYAAFDRGDIDTILASLSDDVRWGAYTTVDNDVPWVGAHKGPTEVGEGFFGSIAENVDITLFDRKTTVASGDHVAVAYRIEGTLKKNGNSFIDEGMQLWTLGADGKIVEYVAYADTAAVLKAWTG